MAAMLWLTKSTVRPSSGDFLNFSEALFLKGMHRQQQVLRRQRECHIVDGLLRQIQAARHAAAVAFDRGVQVFFASTKLNDLV